MLIIVALRCSSSAAPRPAEAAISRAADGAPAPPQAGKCPSANLVPLSTLYVTYLCLQRRYELYVLASCLLWFSRSLLMCLLLRALLAGEAAEPGDLGA